MVGLAATALQPLACGRGDLRRDAARALVDDRASFLGDPGPSIVAAGRLRHDARAPVYDRDLAVGSAFIYPPIAAWPYGPLAGRPPHEARASLWQVSRALLVACLGLVVAVLTVRRRPTKVELVVAVLGALAFFPLLHALQLNQATLGVSALVGAAFVALLVDRPVAAGVALGVACAIKPHLVLVLPLLVFHARRTAVAGFLTGAALLAASLSYAGLANHVAYATKVLPTIARGYPYWANQSANGLYQRLFIDADIGVFVLPPPYAPVQILTTLSLVLGYATAAVVVFRARHREGLAPEVLAFAWLVCTLTSPIAWQHHYVPALFVLALLRRSPGLAPPWIVAAAWVLMASYFEVRGLRDPVALLLASHVFFGALLLTAALGRGLIVAARTPGIARSAS